MKGTFSGKEELGLMFESKGGDSFDPNLKFCHINEVEKKKKK